MAFPRDAYVTFLKFVSLSIAFAGGFVVASAMNQNTHRWIWAEGESGEHQVALAAAQATHEPDVWPSLEHSLSEEVDLLSPEPLYTPISSLGPASTDSAALLAALMWATERPAAPLETKPVLSPGVQQLDQQTERPSQREPKKKSASMRGHEPVSVKKQQAGRKQEENGVSAEPEQLRLFD